MICVHSKCPLKYGICKIVQIKDFVITIYPKYYINRTEETIYTSILLKDACSPLPLRGYYFDERPSCKTTANFFYICGS